MQEGKTFFRKIPFLRPLIALMAGIVAQHHATLPPLHLLATFLTSVAALIIFGFLNLNLRFRFRKFVGLLLAAMVFALGGLLTYNKNIVHDEKWFGVHDSNLILVTLSETTIEKAGSMKAVARVNAVHNGGEWQPCTGQLIVYFRKTSVSRILCGTQILIRKKAVPIAETGNPGAFSYRDYCAKQNITHQVFIDTSEFRVVGTTKNNLEVFLDRTVRKLVAIIKEHINGKTNQGLAEALLIGYKNDLDKDLLLAYSKTGVVHVIAISGLHLGLIYTLLLFFTRPLQYRSRLLQATIILTCLWLFTLLAGTQPSILRSAVMFSCIIVGKTISRNSNILNSLACSAFLLLAYNPFWVWDAGFQLSYSALLGIIIFMKPIYHLLIFRNKLIDLLWQLIAVTLAAQVLTTPISMFLFHQFPNYFIATNIIAVPLSGLILFAGIVVCIVSPFHFIADIVGDATTFLIRIMNDYVIFIGDLPYSTTGAISINLFQVILLYLFIVGFAINARKKNFTSLVIGLCSLLAFFVIRYADFLECSKAKRMVVFNSSGGHALGFTSGRKSMILCDSSFVNNRSGYDFNIRPAHTLWRIKGSSSLLKPHRNNIKFLWNKKSVLICDAANLAPADIVVVSGKKMKRPLELPEIREMIILTPGLPAYIRNELLKTCKEKGIRVHDIAQHGAFVMKLP